MDCSGSIRTVLVPGAPWPAPQFTASTVPVPPKEAQKLYGEAAASRVLQYTLTHPWLNVTAIKIALTMGAVQTQKALDRFVKEGQLQVATIDAVGRKSTIYAAPGESPPVLKIHTIRSSILSYLHRHPGSTSAEIIDGLGLKSTQVSVALVRLYDTHQVRKDARQRFAQYWAVQ